MRRCASALQQHHTTTSSLIDVTRAAAILDDVRKSILRTLVPAFVVLHCLTAQDAFLAWRADAAPNSEEAEFRELQQMRPRKGLVISEEPLTKEYETWNKDVAQQALVIADRAHKFLTEYLDSTHRKPVAEIERGMLLVASKGGDSSARERLETAIEVALKQSDLSEKDRLALRWQEIENNLAVNANQGERALAADMERAAQNLIKEFPHEPGPYLMLLHMWDARNDTSLVQEVLTNAQAPEEARQKASNILSRFALRSHPLEMRFVALDGQELDLAKLRGKVILIDFWATWCGPCVAEIPTVKAAYDKFHNRGFDVVGISLDQDREKLLQFVKARGLPWPQYFDGKRWQNKYAQTYGLSSIPVMWLVSREGVVADWDARNDLAAKVEKLLGN
ncbi:MAG: hypothetical protein C5B50_13960 [Verrucomicrobia bacterium]|nr:MAG: hypothetical protein C5B50_13960 [Verrucomicrobiota bacterium]